MPDKQIDGVKKLSKEELERSRRLVLESIGERPKPEAVSPPAKRLDGLKPAPVQAKPAPVIGPDLLGAAKRAATPAPSKPAPEPAAPPAEKADPALPPVVSKVNPFQNEAMAERIREKERAAEEERRRAEAEKARRAKEEWAKAEAEKARQAEVEKARQAAERKRLAEEKRREAELKRRQDEIERAEKKKRLERERAAREERRQRRLEAAKERRARWLARWESAARAARRLPSLVLGLARRALLALVFLAVVGTLLYSVYVLAVVEFGLDRPLLRKVAKFVPAPAYVGRDGIFEYYHYKDKVAALAGQGLGGQELAKAAKSAAIEEVVMGQLSRRYGLAGQGLEPAELRSRVVQELARDNLVNQVGIARIAKIRDLIAQSGDFVATANKYGDSQGQLTITPANRGQYPYYGQISGLAVNQNSDIVFAPDGYYIFRCYERRGEDLYLSYVFVRAIGLDEYLARAIDEYWLWSLVD